MPKIVPNEYLLYVRKMLLDGGKFRLRVERETAYSVEKLSYWKTQAFFVEAQLNKNNGLGAGIGPKLTTISKERSFSTE